MIVDNTPIIPEIVAENVVGAVPNASQLIAKLVTRAEMLYTYNVHWRKLIQAPGNKGRDTLYAFMEHWLKALEIERKT